MDVNPPGVYIWERPRSVQRRAKGCRGQGRSHGRSGGQRRARPGRSGRSSRVKKSENLSRQPQTSSGVGACRKDRDCAVNARRG